MFTSAEQYFINKIDAFDLEDPVGRERIIESPRAVRLHATNWAFGEALRMWEDGEISEDQIEIATQELAVEGYLGMVQAGKEHLSV